MSTLSQCPCWTVKIIGMLVRYWDPGCFCDCALLLKICNIIFSPPPLMPSPWCTYQTADTEGRESYAYSQEAQPHPARKKTWIFCAPILALKYMRFIYVPLPPLITFLSCCGVECIYLDGKHLRFVAIFWVLGETCLTTQYFSLLFKWNRFLSFPPVKRPEYFVLHF